MTSTLLEQAATTLSPVQEKVQRLRRQALEYDYDYHLVWERRRHLVSKIVLLLRPAHVVRLLKRFGYACTPQLVRSLAWGEHAPTPKVFPTSYLNGLRGITAVKVFTFHYSFAYSDFGFQPWGINERHHYFLELPIIRYFYSGFTSHVFFGIAGYLTSLRLFQLLDKNDTTSHSKVLLNVSGSLFRRAFRLYLPVFLITFITTMYIYLGFYEFNRPLILDREKYFPGEWYEPKPERMGSLSEQLKFWCHEMFDLTNIVTENTIYPSHDQHLWSILSEMRASLHLYGILIMTAQCKKNVRIIVMLCLAFFYFLWNHWEIWVYILGAIVAQVDLLLTERELAEHQTLVKVERPPSPPPPYSGFSTPTKTHNVNNYSSPPPLPTPSSSPLPPTPQISKPLREWPTLNFTPTSRTLIRHNGAIRSGIRFAAFLIAFYFLSYPIDGAGNYSPGYMTLNTLIPEWMDRKDKFYPNLGTALLLLLLARSNPQTSRWRQFLTSPIPLYLGKISFALYLVHGPIMHAVGYLLPHWIWWSLGVEGVAVRDVPWALTIMAGWAVTLTLSLCVADVWAREVEGRCAKFIKRLEDAAFVKRV